MRVPRCRIAQKLALVCGLLIMVVLFFGFNGEFDVKKTEQRQTIERAVRSALNKGECQLPHLPVDNPEIMKYYKPVDKIKCGNESNWVTCQGSTCGVIPEISKKYGDITCSYMDIIRKTDFKNRLGRTAKTKSTYLLQRSDFVKVSCRSAGNQRWSGIVHGIRNKVERHTKDLSPHEGLYNVLMFGFDSLSRNSFIRKLPRTYNYLTKELGAIVLQGYNIVGDGTPQALIPLLTGYTELELPETRRRISGSVSMNSYPMIWQNFANLGYMTMFNEDAPNVGTFTYRMNGFDEQPVDHYLRTFYLEAEHLRTPYIAHCIGQQADHMIMLEYTKNFLLKYRDIPSFGFSFHASLSHDSINLIGAADDDVSDWLASLKEEGLLDNTILLFMSDHGNRFAEVRSTLQGKQEERLPFFSFTFPESFKTRFPVEYKNMVSNKDRLTTPFDIHATLQHIMQLQFAESKNWVDAVLKAKEYKSKLQLSIQAQERAISLFECIPKNRSCGDAYIEPHWCACLTWWPIQLNDTNHTLTISNAANSIVSAINTGTAAHRDVCATLNLQQINWALRLHPQKALLQFKKNKDVDGFTADLTDKMELHEEFYQLQLVTQPGEAIFEASVSYNSQTLRFTTKLSDVSRINKYGNQAKCIYDRDPETLNDLLAYACECLPIHTQMTFCFIEPDKTVLQQPEQNRIEKNGFALSASELIQEPINRLLSEAFRKKNRHLFADSEKRSTVICELLIQYTYARKTKDKATCT